MATVLLLGAGARFLLSAREHLAVSAAALTPFAEPGFRLDGTARATPSFDIPGVIKAIHPGSRSFELETVRGSLALEGIDRVLAPGDRMVYKMHLTLGAEVMSTTFIAEDGVITGFSTSDIVPLSPDLRELKEGDAVRVGGARLLDNGGKYAAGFIRVINFENK